MLETDEKKKIPVNESTSLLNFINIKFITDTDNLTAIKEWMKLDFDE